MEEKKRTEIARLGEFGLIEKLTGSFYLKNNSTKTGVGDDAAVLDTAADGTDRYTLLSTDMLLEGVDFDLVYFPLKHLGYKAVVVGINDILAMNGEPKQLTVSLGVSSKIGVEQLEELYEGVYAACTDYGVDLVGGDTRASVNGLVISVTATGSVPRDAVVFRSGARPNDLVCITGDLGSAYMGLHLLEREKRALDGHPDPQPDFTGYEYLLRRQLKPTARLDVVEALAENGLVPTSMIDLSDGLASDLLQICKSSDCGARIYLDRLPIARETYDLCEKMNTDPVVAALNGGDDHELLFTVPLRQQDLISRVGGIDVIGHITAANTGTMLVTPDGGEIPITALAIG
ncbi:MAG: thiamine-phosphate kinase [Rikenellaceae bacterium]|nr:thiamine-phosphate kinase [Rikenellaceae bacterium]